MGIATSTRKILVERRVMWRVTYLTSNVTKIFLKTLVSLTIGDVNQVFLSHLVEYL